MTTLGFGRWRSFFWPIRRSELRKFLPMFFIFFLIAFNYNVLRSYKDSIIITASHSGAEAIPFIKLWAVLPSAVLFTVLFTRLSNWFSREKVFYITLSIFLVFFLVFAFVLYPAQEYLHPNELADTLQAILPKGFKGLIAIFRNWTFSLFYVMSELWGTAILSVLFWGFANEVTNVGEAKRFYGVIIASIVVGLLVDLSPLDPIKALVWSAVVNGVIVVPIMVAVMIVASHGKQMGEFVATPLQKIFGWIATVVRAAAAVAMFATM